MLHFIFATTAFLVKYKLYLIGIAVEMLVLLYRTHI